jgi:hypothetical protein
MLATALYAVEFRSLSLFLWPKPGQKLEAQMAIFPTRALRCTHVIGPALLLVMILGAGNAYAFGPAWQMVGVGCTPQKEAVLGDRYIANFNYVAYNSGTGNIHFFCPVSNVTQTPNTLILYFSHDVSGSGSGVSVTAELRRVHLSTGVHSSVCSVVSSDTAAFTSPSCSFTGFDTLTYAYYVLVTLNRNSSFPTAAPRLHAVELFQSVS